MRSIGEVLEKNRGIGPGFDFLRVALAFSVLIWHEPGTFTRTPHVGDGPFEAMFGYCILPMFFGLSGFLITGSALRLKLTDFLINRGMRIFPALGVEITLSAFILGPIFTNLSLIKYFTTRSTYHYLTNIVGLINYALPGVFYQNPTSTINISLWTIPFELGCYVLMSVFILSRALRKPTTVIVVLMFWLSMNILGLFLNSKHIEGVLPNLIDILFCGRGGNLYILFMLGITSYLFRYKIPYNLFVFLGLFIILLLISIISKNIGDIATKCIVFPILIYFVAFIGVSPLSKLPIFHRGDYSYGIYLYGAVIQQAVRAAMPQLPPALHFAVSILLVTVFAIFSWHAIERPILGLRKRFSFVARQRGIEAVPENAVAPNEGKF